MKKIYHISIIILALIIIVGAVFVYQKKYNAKPDVNNNPKAEQDITNMEPAENNRDVLNTSSGNILDSKTESPSETRSEVSQNEKVGEKFYRYSFQINPNLPKYYFDLYPGIENTKSEGTFKISVHSAGGGDVQMLEGNTDIFYYSSYKSNDYLSMGDYNNDEYNDLYFLINTGADGYDYYSVWVFDSNQKKFIYNNIYFNSKTKIKESYDWQWIGHDNFWGVDNHFPKIRIYYPKDWGFMCCLDKEGVSDHYIENKKEGLKIEINQSVSNYRCISSECGMDGDYADVGIDKAYEEDISNYSKYNKVIPKMYIKNLGLEAFGYLGKDYDGKETKFYVIKSTTVLRIGFVDYKKFEDGFIEKFLNKLEPEDF